jgi:integrase
VPALGKTRLRDLRRAHVEAVIARLAKPVQGERVPGRQGRRVQRRSAATVDGYRRTLRAALSAAVRRGLIVTNPAQGRLDSLPDREDKELAIWEPEATAAFLNHVADDRLAALYELAAYAGMRRGELCGLRWSDLDAGYVGLTVRQTLVEVSAKDIPDDQRTCGHCGATHTGLMFKGPKSRAGRRWLPLAQPAREALQAHRAAQLEERAGLRGRLLGPRSRVLHP